MTGADAIAGHLAEIGLDAERRGPREWAVQVPCSKRGAVGVLLRARERTLSMQAFIMRGPDRAHEDVYRRLLQKNLATRHWRFAIDAVGDVHALADAPLAALDGDLLDGLLGALSALVDETYESIVRTGFDVPEGTEFRPPPGAGTD
ncbi:YbjN domain-containing protein [Miltoncostaea marina]|uniref:YbjN domain-containing protein n=1 Tax=Miltoncostaea marina TaxID=2843215 RepID=UPI001C3DE8E7|nr:YbjN domain-containing protein [Miltoncostaea marina]